MNVWEFLTINWFWLMIPLAVGAGLVVDCGKKETHVSGCGISVEFNSRAHDAGQASP